MITVRLYGKLEKFGKESQIHVGSIPELIRALCTTRPGFKKSLKAGMYEVWIDDVNISKSEVQVSVPEGCLVRIIPVIEGAKNAGAFQFILGVVLIAVGAYTGNPTLMKLGFALSLGGLAQMLAPQPSEPVQAERANNKAFTSVTNTAAQGTCVPVVLGRMRVGSKSLSAGLAAADGKNFKLTEEFLTQ